MHMFNSGFIPSVDGSEHIFDVNIKANDGLPLKYSYMHTLPEVINQGNDPTCVPCSISAWLNWKTNLSLGKKSDNSVDIYEVFDGGDGKEDGMTCKAAFKYIIDNGVNSDAGKLSLSRYFLIKSIFALRHAIVANGPCVAVLPVYNTDIDEFWDNRYNIYDFIGYHAIAVVGYDESGFIIRNSWGDSYGKDGYAYVPNEDMNKCKEIWTLC